MGLRNRSLLKSIGIVGFGRFGRLSAHYLGRDFEILFFDPSGGPIPKPPKNTKRSDLEKVCRQDLIILAVPISALKSVLEEISPSLKPGSLVIDVCSVKMLPVKWMKQTLPEEVSILATHPMFGPDSAGKTLSGAKIALCPVRIENKRLDRIKGYLERLGLEVIVTTPDEHDRQIAKTLCLVHLIGRSLSILAEDKPAIDTEGFKRLMHILEVVENDSWQLFLDMHRYNPHAAGIRKTFIEKLISIDRIIQSEIEPDPEERGGEKPR